MRYVAEGLAKGLPGFKMVNPGLGHLAKARWLKYALKGIHVVRPIVFHKKQEKSMEDAVATVVGNVVLSGVLKPSIGIFKSRIVKQYMKSMYTKRGPGSRTWINLSLESDSSGRVIKPLAIVYHDADKAGKHIDIHIGHLSLIMRVENKKIENFVKFNRKGELTQESKNALLEHVREEIANHSRLPQNLDHTLGNAKSSWLANEKGVTGYGSGFTRQLIASDYAEFYHKNIGSSLHMYAPIICKSRGLYLYKLQEVENRTPICIWGMLSPNGQQFKERLHLKMINAHDIDKFFRLVDHKALTRKYDGASSYFATIGEGIRLFSPRLSKETGHRIEYTYKIPELSNIKGVPMDTNESGITTGMGEILFWKHTLPGRMFQLITGHRGPEWICWNYLSAGEIGGILNSSSIRPRAIRPEYRLYRIDKFHGKDTSELSFFSNRKLQKIVTSSSNLWLPVRKVKPVVRRFWEGLVGAPPNKSINEGYKIKWWGDTYDWLVEAVDFKKGPKGKVAGVVWFKSLESGRKFKLGPGQMGSESENLEIMANPDSYTGKVAKVISRRGHEGRAAKRVSWHLDKGVG